MISRIEHDKIIKAIDTLLVKRGTVKNKVINGHFTAKEVLENAGTPNTELNWNYIIHLMKTNYIGSTWERGSQDDGWNLKVKTRIK